MAKFETNGEPLCIWGASDDLVELEGGVIDEIGCFGQAVRLDIGDPTKGGIVVVMRYGRIGKGVWTAEVAQFDEDIEIPWDVTVANVGRGYSVKVIVACPAGTQVKATKIKRKS